MYPNAGELAYDAGKLSAMKSDPQIKTPDQSS
jgi:hypothetical protein